jgi:protein-tyrosine-phosphatase
LDWTRRRLILSIVAFIALGDSVRAISAQPEPHILFVCQFGTVKSATARELLRREANRRGVKLTVQSRGLTPENHMSPELHQRLASDGIKPESEPVRRLRSKDIAAADIVIAFDPLPARFHPRRFEDWSDLPSMVNDYENARSILDRRIEQLLDRYALR